MDPSPDSIDAFARARPGSTKMIRGILSRYAAHVEAHPGASPEEWIATLTVSDGTASTYRGVIQSFTRASTPEVTSPAAAAPRSRRVPPPAVAPAEEIGPPRIRLRPGVVAERVLAGAEPPAAMSEDFLGRLAAAVSEQAGIGAMRAKLDEIAVALDLLPIVRPPFERGPDVPAEVLRHQLTALALALGVGPTAALLDLAPSAIDRMLRGGGVPRLVDVVDVDTAYVRLRWLQRDLAEDEELDDLRDQMRSIARDELDARAEGRAAEGGH